MEQTLGQRDASEATASETPRGVPPSAASQTDTPGLATTARLLLRQLRVHQWSKNGLVVLPALLAHRTLNVEAITQLLLAVAALCCTASTVYVFNDLKDLADDRLHPTKCKRPFASGRLSLSWAPWLLVALPLLAATACLALPPVFAMVIGVYVATNLLYTFLLKRIMLLDVFVLVGMYELRILAGGLVLGVPISPWLWGLSLFFFLSLAFVKRHVELDDMAQKADAANGASASESDIHRQGRGYRPTDRAMLAQFGIACGYLSVLVLAIYISGGEAAKIYDHHEWMWLACPILLFWITRLWLLVGRGEVHSDPVVFALKDPTSWLLVIATLTLVGLAA